MNDKKQGSPLDTLLNLNIADEYRNMGERMHAKAEKSPKILIRRSIHLYKYDPVREAQIAFLQRIIDTVKDDYRVKEDTDISGKYNVICGALEEIKDQIGITAANSRLKKVISNVLDDYSKKASQKKEIRRYALKTFLENHKDTFNDEVSAGIMKTLSPLRNPTPRKK